ncbi:MAG TPA: hypothetical protein VFZ59_08805 [Verrucomicrobiae bacterium]|nr:hypothetical protein [Verrucomicrobiae bacterium]
MRSREQLVKTLQGLDPLSNEFYNQATAYFWGRCRSHRNYGYFFIFLAVVSWVLAYIHWGKWLLTVWSLFAYCFAAFLGWLVVNGASHTARVLADADKETDPERRLRRLRAAARTYRGDKVSLCVLSFPSQDD